MKTIKAVVTGVAGFIGSRLAHELVTRGADVTGIDSFTTYYSPHVKKLNLQAVADAGSIRFHELDLRSGDLPRILEGADCVFHLAGQPGVRPSWRQGFSSYARLNVEATHNLLSACADMSVKRLVFSSSSSVYGEPKGDKSQEIDRCDPLSPYGVTKLASENLCSAFGDAYGMKIVSLRYFTVYGAHQRPDMALYRIIKSALTGEPFVMNGDGSQTRDFTHVSDVVQANLSAMDYDGSKPLVANIAGGTSGCSLMDLIEIVQEEVGKRVPISLSERALGDARVTAGDTAVAAEVLGWTPQVGLLEGVAEQVEWMVSSNDDPA